MKSGTFMEPEVKEVVVAQKVVEIEKKDTEI